ncbi:hypothetical protein GGR56DRAFT_624282 [Xylariaceae sp. FL0804]|nr:hypothetical protein GGR56DRAFT_624282 [Xylariaceae sp. FL0804]
MFLSSRLWLPTELKRVYESCVSLVRASAQEAETSDGLSELEFYGNMFVLSFAGHDTTTRTLTFAIMYLVFKEGQSEKTVNINRVFPGLSAA